LLAVAGRELGNRLARAERWVPERMIAVDQLFVADRGSIERLPLGVVDLGKLMLALALEGVVGEIRLAQTFDQQLKTKLLVLGQHFHRTTRRTQRERTADVFDQFGDLGTLVLGGSLVEQAAHEAGQPGLLRRLAK